MPMKELTKHPVSFPSLIIWGTQIWSTVCKSRPWQFRL